MNKSNRLDAVLPLLLKDFDSFVILDRSLKKFCANVINTCWVVTRDSEYNEINQRISKDIYRVVPESQIIPELKFYRFLKRAIYGRYGRIFNWTPLKKEKRFDIDGWQIQQVIKLSIAERIETDFYLTLDSDVVCIRPLCYEDIVRNGRAITNIEEDDVHPNWYKNAERILGFSRSGLTHGVTPAILNKLAVLELQKFLADKVHPILRYSAKPLPNNSLLRQLMISWRSFLIRNTPWTEYSLYHTFLEGTNRFEQWHTRDGPDAMYSAGNCVWTNEQWKNWDIDNSSKEKTYFVVIQSTAEIEPQVVWDKISRCFQT
jgi:hypothetical protein